MKDNRSTELAYVRAMALLLAGLLAGCTATSPQEARELGPEKRYAFRVDADYQEVYRRIIEPMRRCYQSNMITAQAMVNGDLYHDTKSATIVSGLYGALGPSIYRVIDIRGLEGKTEVVAIFHAGNIERQGGIIKTWATGRKYDGC